MCKIFLNLTIKIPERRHWRCSAAFIVNFEQIFGSVLVFPLLNLNKYMPAGLPLRKRSSISKILTLSWRRPLSNRNQSIDVLRKSMDWFLYDYGLRHERVQEQYVKGVSVLFQPLIFNLNCQFLKVFVRCLYCDFNIFYLQIQTFLKVTSEVINTTSTYGVMLSLWFNLRSCSCLLEYVGV